MAAPNLHTNVNSVSSLAVLATEQVGTVGLQV